MAVKTSSLSGAWASEMAFAGHAFGAHFGTVTTPLQTPSTAAITAKRPQVWLRVPAGTLIIPTSVEIVIESAGATTQGEIAIAMAQNDVGNGTSAAGTSGAISLDTKAPHASGCTPRQLATADVTAETNLLELKRFSFAASAVDQVFSWTPAQNMLYPVLRGAASLLVYIGGNAVNFYAQVQWIETEDS